MASVVQVTAREENRVPASRFLGSIAIVQPPVDIPTQHEPIGLMGRRRRAGWFSIRSHSPPILFGRRTIATNSPATAEDLGDALSFALCFQGRKRVHNADELMSSIVAESLVEHLERCGFAASF